MPSGNHTHIHRLDAQALWFSEQVVCRPFLSSESPSPVPAPVCLKPTPGPWAQNRLSGEVAAGSRLP